jgi:hypothetical protein
VKSCPNLTDEHDCPDAQRDNFQFLEGLHQHLFHSETCEGWNLAGIDALLQRVNTEWDKYGCMVSY